MTDPDDIAEFLAELGLEPYEDVEARKRKRAKKPDPPLVISTPEAPDDPAAFLAELGLTQETNPKIVECSVPTRPIQAQDLDVFDPLDGYSDAFRQKLGLDLAERLLDSGPFPLAGIAEKPFDGDGIYALYSHGDLVLYLPCRSPGSTYPLYVGKSNGEDENGARNLHKRLVLHAESIAQTDLGLENFTYRFVCLPPVWVRPAEDMLRKLFRPIWDGTGFGNKVTGGNRQDQVVSIWDALHPGRKGVGLKPRINWPYNRQDAETFIEQRLPDCLRAYEATMTALRERSEPAETEDAPAILH